MFCPNCAEPVKGAKFCRSCGTNVAIISLVLSERSPENQPAAEITDTQRQSVFLLPKKQMYLWAGFLFALISPFSAKLPILAVLGWLILSAIALCQAIIEERREKQKQRPKPQQSFGEARLITDQNPLKLDTGKIPHHSVAEETTKQLDIR